MTEPTARPLSEDWLAEHLPTDWTYHDHTGDDWVGFRITDHTGRLLAELRLNLDALAR